MNEIDLNNISIIKSSLKKNVTINENNNKSRLKKSPSSTMDQQQQVSKVPFRPASTHLSYAKNDKSFKKTIAENSQVGAYDNEKSTLFSTWTPLLDDNSNKKLFEERKQLCIKWLQSSSLLFNKLRIN
jgi:hypothetical protein